MRRHSSFGESPAGTMLVQATPRLPASQVGQPRARLKETNVIRDSHARLPFPSIAQPVTGPDARAIMAAPAGGNSGQDPGRERSRYTPTSPMLGGSLIGAPRREPREGADDRSKVQYMQVLRACADLAQRLVSQSDPLLAAA